jgi:hypothetical protein
MKLHDVMPDDLPEQLQELIIGLAVKLNEVVSDEPPIGRW